MAVPSTVIRDAGRFAVKLSKNGPIDLDKDEGIRYFDGFFLSKRLRRCNMAVSSTTGLSAYECGTVVTTWSKCQKSGRKEEGETEMIKTAALCLAASALVSASASADTIFSNDFESGLGGNESVDGIFTVNNTSSLGNGSFGVGHDANGYTSGEWSSYYLTLDLSNYQNVLLTFDFSGDIENHFDGFNVVDEGTALITPLSGMTYDSQLGHFHTPFTTGGDDYYDSSAEGSGTAMFDLSAQGYDGNGISNVTFRFQFGSDGSVTFAGIWMDNVTVTGDLIPAPGAVALLGLGGIGFMGRRRRR